MYNWGNNASGSVLLPPLIVVVRVVVKLLGFGILHALLLFFDVSSLMVSNADAPFDCE